MLYSLLFFYANDIIMITQDLKNLLNDPGDALSVNNGARCLIIACGALAKEILHIRSLNNMDETLDIQCLPAKLHNTPQKIPALLQEKIRQYKKHYDHIIIGFADCGTGGLLQKMCAEEGVEYLAGAHCYGVFTGNNAFDHMARKEIGTFYLTDYLTRHFESLIIKGMGLAKYPEMRDMMFSNYTKVVYLAQTDDNTLTKKASECAQYLKLDFKRIYTGYGELNDFITQAKEKK